MAAAPVEPDGFSADAVDDSAAPEDSRAVLRTVDRALRVLEIFAGPKRDWSYADLTRASGIHKTILYRLLATLEARAFVERDPRTRVYRVGPRLRQLASWDDEIQLLLRTAAPESSALVDSHRETVWLAVQKGYEVVGVDQVEGPHVLRASLPPGARNPLYRTAPGKAILAFLSTEDQERVIDDARHREPDLAARVGRELASIRRAGYAESDSEAYAGVAGMSAPIFDWRGSVMASIGLVGPSTRLTHRWRVDVAPEVVAAAARITARMSGTLEDDR
ncbi:MAG: IclR family transcriptional regulator [Chloroflexota bacterium]